MTDDLVTRLRKVDPDTPGERTRWYRNPDGPEAADRIEQLETALRFYKNGFQYHPKRTITGVDLSEWRPKDELLDDCGETARAALEGKDG